jgi:hypothetical protein
MIRIRGVEQQRSRPSDAATLTGMSLCVRNSISTALTTYARVVYTCIAQLESLNDPAEKMRPDKRSLVPAFAAAVPLATRPRFALQRSPRKPRVTVASPSPRCHSPMPVEPASNPFFAKYAPEELAALWDLHKDVVGEREARDDTTVDEVGNVGQSRGGGLHDLVMQACEEPQPTRRTETDGGTNDREL